MRGVKVKHTSGEAKSRVRLVEPNTLLAKHGLNPSQVWPNAPRAWSKNNVAESTPNLVEQNPTLSRSQHTSGRTRPGDGRTRFEPALIAIEPTMRTVKSALFVLAPPWVRSTARIWTNAPSRWPTPNQKKQSPSWVTPGRGVVGTVVGLVPVNRAHPPALLTSTSKRSDRA